MEQATERTDRPPRWRAALPMAIIVAAIALVYGQVLSFDFVTWDDDQNVTRNPHLVPLSWQGLGYLWTHHYFAIYVPITYSAWALLGWVSESVTGGPGFSPTVLHLGNLMVHVVSALLVYRLLLLLVASQPGAVAGALLFALHPLQVENVAWVSGLMHLLAGVLSLSALWLYLGHARGVQRGEPLRRRRILYWSAAGCYLLALLAKPSAAALPLIAWVIDRVLVGRDWRAATRALAPWLLPAAAIAVALPIIDPQAAAMARTPLWLRPLVAGDSLVFYLSKLVAPRHLTIDYGRTLEALQATRWFYLAWVVPVALGWLICRLRHPRLTAAAGVLLAGLLPMLGLLSVPFQEYSTVADRYMYLAMLGPALGLAALVRAWPAPRVMAVVGLLLALLALQTAMQTMHWHDDMTLYNHALERNPRSWAALGNAGTALFNQGKRAEGLGLLERCLQVNPAAIAPRLNIIEMLLVEGRLDAAIHHLRELVRYNGQFAKPHDYLGCALNTAGQVEEARAEWREAIRVEPRYLAAYHNLALSLRDSGETDEAIAVLRQALTINPRYEKALTLLAELEADRPQPDTSRPTGP